VIMLRMRALNVMYPSEPTKVHVVALLAFATGDASGPASIDPMATLRDVTTSVRYWRGVTPPRALPFIVTWGQNPNDLRIAHPQLFEAAYGEKHPVASKVDS
ncbi:unnamed protein product, partial [Prorocentrum cordatum]